MSKVKKTLIVFLSFILVSLFTFGFSVSASTVYKMPFSQPLASDTSGYVECLMSNGDIYVYFFQSVGRSTNQAYVDVSPNSLKLTLVDNSTNTDNNRISLVYGFMRIPNDYYGIYSSVGQTTTMSQNMWVPDWCTIVSVKAYGFVRLYATNGVETGSNWQVIYGSDTVIVNQLNVLVSAITSQNQQVIDNADKNASNIQSNADKNASETQANDDKNTQAIIDNQNELQEKEKTETQNQGEGSVNDVSGAIEDKSAGFISSIGNLVSAMSYNGTSCAWKFPALKLPAIDGVMPEINLTDEKPIDFEYWVNKMPANVLLLVRSLLTIALIGYCFKELYDTISYVLTLKGGGNSE